LSVAAAAGNPSAPGFELPAALRYVDLVLLALALPVFVLAELPVTGYAVAAGAWLAQRAVQAAADRRMIAQLKAGNRRAALGITAFATLGRVWLLALAILLVGKLAEREDGLAAAVLSAILVTAYLGSMAIARLLAPPEPQAAAAIEGTPR
jgi:succinate-acetate transporter protein